MTKTRKKNTSEQLAEELRKVVERWVDSYVKRPALETVENAILEQGRIANALACSAIFEQLIYRKGSNINIEHLKSLPKQELLRRKEVLTEYVKSRGNSENKAAREASKIVDDSSSRKYLLLYLESVTTWIAVSILAASYISSLVLIRSLFELVIGIATRKTGGMKERLDSIKFLSPEEKREAKKTYDELCAWAHPYGKWTKETCPIFVWRGGYHPELFKLCIEKLERIIDLMLIIAIHKFDIKGKVLLNQMKKDKINILRFALFSRRT